MRLALAALAAAAVLAVTEAPAQALTLLPPAGQYLGTASNGAHILFSLDLSDLDHTKVVDFRINGTKYFSAAPWHYDNNTYGYFNVRVVGHGNMHVWGNWKSEYGHMHGGYAYDYNGHRVTRHFEAKADGF